MPKLSRALILLACMAAESSLASILSEASIGQSLSGTFTSGKSFALKQQILTLASHYRGDLRYSLLPGKNHFLLGGSLHTGSLSYRAGDSLAQGMHLAFGLRGGYAWSPREAISVFLLPELMLDSRLSAASFSESFLDGRLIQSASLSEYSGRGGFGFSLGGNYRFAVKWFNFQPYLGLSLLKLKQSYQQKKDRVVSTTPSSGLVESLSKTSRGQYSLDSWAIQLQVGSLL